MGLQPGGRLRRRIRAMLVVAPMFLMACQPAGPKAETGAPPEGKMADPPVTEKVRGLMDTPAIRAARLDPDVVAGVQLVQPYLLREGGQRDVFAKTNAYQAALLHFRTAASRGNSVAAACAGIIDVEGGAQATDFQEAATLFQQAVDQGYGLSGFDLAILYQRGDGVPPDTGRAAQLQSIAAAQGHPAAQLMVDGSALLSVKRIAADASDSSAAAGRWTRSEIDQTVARMNRQMDDMLNDFNMRPELIPCMVPADTDPQGWLSKHQPYVGANPPTDVLLHQLEEAEHHLGSL